MYLLFILHSVVLISAGATKSLIQMVDVNKTLNLLEIPSINISAKTPSPVREIRSSGNNRNLKKSKKIDLLPSNDYGDDYEDEDGDEYGGYDTENTNTGAGRNATRQRLIHIIKRVGTTYAWGRWEKWSRCSNSCVQIRKRQCIKRIQNSTDADAIEITFYPNSTSETTGCFGIMKKYRLCKDEKCKISNRQMRNEQCSAYNHQAYRGKFYNWQGYEKEHNECELYCKPIDSDIFISMNQSVTDGTACGKPAIYYTHYYRRKAVCVEGICKPR